MSENEFKMLPFDNKFSILRDMIQQKNPEMLLDKNDLETLTAMIGKHEKHDEQHYVDFYDFMAKKMILLKPVSGNGIVKKAKKIAFGCGFVKPSMKIETNNIDFDSGIEREKTYIPLGRYFVNRHKLVDNKLMIKTIKGGTVHGLSTLTISPKLSKMIHKIVTGKGFPSHNELGDLDDDDKDILHKIFKLSQAEGIEAIPAPSKSRDEQELNRFTILKGEIVSGNNSKELIKEFKVLLLKMMNEGKIGKAGGREILLDLVSLGY